jgi:hypothetical protein
LPFEKDTGTYCAVSSLGGKAAIPTTRRIVPVNMPCTDFMIPADGVVSTSCELHSGLSFVGGNRIPQSQLNKDGMHAASVVPTTPKDNDIDQCEIILKRLQRRREFDGSRAYWRLAQTDRAGFGLVRGQDIFRSSHPPR